MNRSIEILSLEMDGLWTAEELGLAHISLSDLYDLRFVLELMHDAQNEWEVMAEEMLHYPPFRYLRKSRRLWSRWASFAGPYLAPPSLALDEKQLATLRELLEPEERLSVRQIEYASPGSSDLAGVGAVIGHIKDLLLRLLERRDTRRQRELNDERAALENQRTRIENARSFVALARELGYDEVDLRRLMAHVESKQDVLAKLIDDGKLVGVTSEPENGEEA